MPRPRMNPERRQTFCASLGSRNAPQKPAQSKRMSRFHNDKGHFIWKFTGKMLQTKAAPQTLCEPARSKRMSTFHKSHFMEKFAGKNAADQNEPKTARTQKNTLCELVQSKRMSRFHRGHATRKCRGKMPQTKTNPTLCASLRSRNACQHLTRVSL